MIIKLKKVEVKTVCCFERDGNFAIEKRDYVYFNCTEKQAETNALYAVAYDGGSIVKREVKTRKATYHIDDAVIAQFGNEIVDGKEE